MQSQSQIQPSENIKVKKNRKEILGLSNFGITNPSQLSIDNKKMAELRNLLKPKKNGKDKYCLKTFLKKNNIDPAYMNFYKFLKDDSFPLPLLGFLKIVEANGFQVQICVTKKNEPLDDSKEWENFMKSIELLVDTNIANLQAKKPKKETIADKDLKKKKDNKLIQSICEVDKSNSDFDISDIMENLF
jgi:hypothetical protein